MKKIIAYAKRNNFVTAFLIAFAIIVATYIYQKLMQNDGWYIMNDGREIIVNHNFYNYSSFVQPGYSKIVQQWLYSVILFLLYNYTGRIGVYLFVLFEVFLFTCLMLQLAKINKANKTLSLITVFFSVVFISYLNNRPELITYILLTAQLLETEKYIRSGKLRHLVLLVVISLFESNLHSSMLIYHYLFMIAYIFPVFNFKTKKFEKKEYCVWKLIATLFLMIAVSFVNPYTSDAALYLIKVYPHFLNYFVINEMQAVTFLSADGLLLIAGIVITIFLVKKHCLSSEWLYLSAGTLLLAAMAIRNVPVFTIIVSVLLFKSVNLIPLGKINILFDKIRAINKKTAYAICILFVFVPTILFASAITSAVPELKDSYLTPVKAVQWMHWNETRKPESIKVFTGYSLGSFVEYFGYKVFITSNSERSIESINKKGNFLADLDEVNSMETMEDFLQKYDFDYFIYGKDDIIGKNDIFDIYFQQSDQYVELFKGNGYTFVQKKNCNVRYR